MMQSFRNSVRLLAAAAVLTAVACSPESPTGPAPSGQFAPAFDVVGPGCPDGATCIPIEVCKAAVFPGADATDPAALGEYDFQYSINGATPVAFTLDAVPTLADPNQGNCVNTTATILVPNTATSLVVTEFTKIFTSPTGHGELHTIATLGNPTCGSTNALVNAGGIAGTATINFAAGNCATDGKIFFKNQFVPDEDETGSEGCTPGGWRNNDGSPKPNGKLNKDWWTTTALTTTTLFRVAFNIPASELTDAGLPADLTLRQALDLDSNADGTALLKHATAALLNATSSAVDYRYTADFVIAQFQAAWPEGDNNVTKDLFDAANNLGCPQ
jgi:hypothetical protein